MSRPWYRKLMMASGAVIMFIIISGGGIGLGTRRRKRRTQEEHDQDDQEDEDVCEVKQMQVQGKETVDDGPVNV